MTLPRFFNHLFALLAGSTALPACAIDDARVSRDSSCAGLNCGYTPAESPPAEELEPSTSDARDASTPALIKAACGIGSCVPDDPAACAGHVPPPMDGGAGVSDAGSAPPVSSDAGPPDGGAPDVDGNYMRPAPSDDAPNQFACQLSFAGTTVERSCMAAGAQGRDEACTTSADCAPGLGCVRSMESAICLPFCCALEEDACGTGSYCVDRPLRERDREGPLVPVCERADNCSLSEPEDCTGPECVCKSGTVCTAVGTGGTTACLPRGDGTSGDDCPCAPGYHCSRATAKCVKMCDLDEDANADADTCGRGLCQATPVLPAGWGICVGASPDGM